MHSVLKFKRYFDDFLGQIYKIGLSEVKKYRQEAMKVAKRLGYHKTELNEVFEKLRTEKSQLFSSREEIMNHFESLISKIKPKLRKVFGPEIAIPKILDVTVETASNPDAPFASFRHSSDDGQVKGSFVVNIENVTSWFL